MKVQFELGNQKRKYLVYELSQIVDAEPKYLGAPSMAYVVGPFHIAKDASAEIGVEMPSEKLEEILNKMEFRGFPSTRIRSEKVPFVITVPRDKVNYQNLLLLLDAKGELIEHALGIKSIRIEKDKNNVRFTWFDDIPEADVAHAVTNLVGMLCKQSLEQKRVTAKYRKEENEKFAFRVFLIRLGFVGDEYKQDRKVLLRNLKGSAAFKTPKKED